VLFVGVGFVVVGIFVQLCVVRYMVFLLLGMFRVVLGCCPGFRGIVVERKSLLCVEPPMIERKDMTDEQQDAVDRMLWHEAKAIGGLETVKFLERELGLVHWVTCKYRLEVLPALVGKSDEAKDLVDDVGATDVLFGLLENG